MLNVTKTARFPICDSVSEFPRWYMYYAEPRRTWLQKQGYYFVWLNRMADTYFVSKLQVHHWMSIIHLSVSSNIHSGLIVWIHFTNTKSFFKIQKQFYHFRGQISDWNRSNISLTAKSLKHMRIHLPLAFNKTFTLCNKIHRR